MQENKKNKSKLLSLIITSIGLIIITLLILGGALLAGHVWNPKWNPFKQTSDKVMIKNIFKK